MSSLMTFQTIKDCKDLAFSFDSSERVVSYSTPYLNDLGPLLEATDKRFGTPSTI